MAENQMMNDLIARLAEAEAKAKRNAETIATNEKALAEAEAKAKRNAETIATNEKALAEAEANAKRDAETIATNEKALAEAEANAKRDAETIATNEKALAEAEEKAKRDVEALAESNTNLQSMMQLLEAKRAQNIGPPPIIGKQWVQNEQLAFAKICKIILMNLRLSRRWHQYRRKLPRRKGGGTSRRQ
jgi:chromosome segregation ATPase